MRNPTWTIFLKKKLRIILSSKSNRGSESFNLSYILINFFILTFSSILIQTKKFTKAVLPWEHKHDHPLMEGQRAHRGAFTYNQLSQ